MFQVVIKTVHGETLSYAAMETLEGCVRLFSVVADRELPLTIIAPDGHEVKSAEFAACERAMVATRRRRN